MLFTMADSWKRHVETFVEPMTEHTSILLLTHKYVVHANSDLRLTHLGFSSSVDQHQCPVDTIDNSL